ncbi:MAG: PAS domain S-box protein [Gemmatimonadota bacterium]
MDIRTKLIFALVAVSLGSMFVLGAVVSPRVEGYIRDGTVRSLDELAEARSESLGWIISGWTEGAELIASRTQLRASLAAYLEDGSPARAERIRTILTDALEASRNALLLEVLDPDGELVAAVERGRPRPIIDESRMADSDATGVRYSGVAVSDAGPPQVTLLASMEWEGLRAGTLLMTLEAPQLLELTANHRGLGDTGETLIVAGDPSTEIRTLHPTRHRDGEDGAVPLSEATGTLAARALSVDAALLVGGIRDYRGEEVWAATRRVEPTGWALVVKIDRDEGMQPVAEFERWLRRTAIILSAFAIVLGLVLALRFALPIHHLAEVANRIRQGDMSARANTAREDEVGLLARTFNDMADDLEQRMRQLHQFRRFFDVTIDLMCIAGTDGYFKTTNPAFEKALGWSEEELVDRPFLDFVHPEDVEKTVREVSKLAEGIPTVSFENRYRCRDGSYKLLRWTSYPEGDVLYAIAHVLDGSVGP